MDEALFTNVFPTDIQSPAEPPKVAPRTQGRAATGRLRRGDRVRCQRDEPPHGSWYLYDGKVGTVTDPNHEGEIGVLLDSRTYTVYFVPDELVKIPKPKP